MSSDLTAAIVGFALAFVVVGVGLRRNLADVTQNWLPRFGEGSEPATVTPRPAAGQGRRPLSPWQRRFAIWGYLLMGTCNAVFAVLRADDRLLHAIYAAIVAIGAVVLILKRPPSSSDGSVS